MPYGSAQEVRGTRENLQEHAGLPGGLGCEDGKECLVPDEGHGCRKREECWKSGLEMHQEHTTWEEGVSPSENSSREG